MAPALKTLAAVYLAVAALGAAIVGIQMLLPLSVIGPLGQWTTPAILAVVGATLLASGSLFWLSDLLVHRMIGSSGQHHAEITPRPCFLCGADLLRDALTCPSCGALVRDREPARA